MSEDRRDDVVLGRSLAETAALNAPEQTEARRADEAVRRAVRGQRTPRTRRRAFALAVALLLTVIAGLAALLWAIAPPAVTPLP